jgi:hypothetical protein
MLALASPIGASSIIQPAAGLFAAGTPHYPSTTPGAGFAWFQVRAWEAAFGTSYEAVVNNTTPQAVASGARGTSNIIRVKTGDPINNIARGSADRVWSPRFLCLHSRNPVLTRWPRWEWERGCSSDSGRVPLADEKQFANDLPWSRAVSFVVLVEL